jgi:hypothetical protein
MATLPGIPLHERFGFHISGSVDITLPDSVPVPRAALEKPLGD